LEFKSIVSLSPYISSLQWFEASDTFSNISLGFENCLQIKKLDDTEFRNAFGRAYIRVSIVACLEYFELLMYLTVHHILTIGEGV
jgi:hypothetical protein